MGRLLRLRFVPVLVAVLLGQAAFVQPSAALADDCVPIGGGLLVCGGGGPQGGPPIVVTGPEDFIVQGTSRDVNDPNDKSAASAWGWIEQEGKAFLGALHSIDVDSRLTDYGRDELRAYIFGRLLQIAQKPANQRTADEQSALYHLQKLIQAKKIAGAQNAVAQYNAWNANKCGFQWPSNVSSTPHEYLDRTGTESLCDSTIGGLFGNPSPPSAEEFTAIGNAMAYSALTATSDAGRVANAAATAGIFLGGLGAAAATAAIAGILVASIPAISSLFVTSGALAIFPFAAFGTAAGAAGGAAAGAGAAVAAVGIASVVAVVVIFVIVTAIAIWQLVTDANVPISLNASLTDAQNNVPNMADMAGSNEGVAQLFATFLEQTLPDYPEQRTDSPAAHDGGDPDFLMTQHTGGNVPLPSSNTISPVDWTGTGHTAYLSRGWWIDNPAGGDPAHHALSIKYVNWTGEHWTAAVAGETFIHSRDGQPDDTFLSPDIEYVGPASIQYKATWHGNRRPTVAPSYSGTLTEGNTLTFHANASDPDSSIGDGDPVTVKWLFEPVVPGFSLVPSDGRTMNDHCLNDAIGTTFGSSPPLLICPWSIVNGTDPTVGYGDNGTFNVRVVATDSHGATAQQTFPVTIGNRKPPVTLSDPVTFSIDEGGQVTVAGSFNDPGDDQVRVDVNWGDGASSTKWFPCSYGPFDPVNCSTIVLPLPAAPHPSNFSFTHTYADDPAGNPNDYDITVTATDDNGGSDTATATATVANVAPTMDLRCGYTSPPDLIPPCFHLGGGDARYGFPGDDIPVNGRFVDPGTDGETHTLHVDWGDGTTKDYTYPCVDVDCPFTTESTISYFLPGPGVVYWHLTHAYATTGTKSISFKVTDGDGGEITGAASAVIRPSPNPTVVITTPADDAVYLLNRHVLADYACDDNSGISSCIGPVADGSEIDTSSIGLKSFTVDALATDSDTGTRTHTYRVVYPFRFIGSTNSAPFLMSRKAGATLAFRFKIGGDQGLDILSGRPTTRLVNCGSGAPLSAPANLRRYELHHGVRSLAEYRLLWKTRPAWAGTCRSVSFTLDDGTLHSVVIRFKAPAA